MMKKTLAICLGLALILILCGTGAPPYFCSSTGGTIWAYFASSSGVLV